ncbi:MAG: hypothetical protein A3E87_04210 [Gammaproteobacteria bacterium RIFCSPHIGHO2_12_FULL_35_23]|nr:MAG: hypothetical protein A3E87_04210 [Gammaproteobacteria bacterium RIFCSPHIGHO2_12_FULL_35_23]
MKKIIFLLLLFTTTTVYAAHPNSLGFRLFLSTMIPLTRAHGISQSVIHHNLLTAEYLSDVINKDSNQPESVLNYNDYMKLFVTSHRINQGIQFYQQNQSVLNKISRQYHVQPGYLVAILGAETNYGKNLGTYPVISALATLAYFDHRHVFFKKELIAALKIIQNSNFNKNKMTGSWAGAIGQCQFMPSLYLNYAVSYLGNKSPDIWNNPADALASTANYFHQQGWQYSENTALRVKLPVNFPLSQIGLNNHKTISEWQHLGVKTYHDESFPTWQGLTSIILLKESSDRTYLVNNNFIILLKWNASYLYALAITQLANKISVAINTLPKQPKIFLTAQTTVIITIQRLPDRFTVLNHRLNKIKQKVFNFTIYKTNFYQNWRHDPINPIFKNQ